LRECILARLDDRAIAVEHAHRVLGKMPIFTPESIVNEPLSGSLELATSFRRVDLPAPFTPIRHTGAPSAGSQSADSYLH
jgi:hypothetical protein